MKENIKRGLREKWHISMVIEDVQSSIVKCTKCVTDLCTECINLQRRLDMDKTIQYKRFEVPFEGDLFCCCFVVVFTYD